MYGRKHCGETPADCKAVDWNKVSHSYSKVLARQPCKIAVGLNAGRINLYASRLPPPATAAALGQRQWARESEQPRPDP